jgi:hypothetical protein
MDQYAGSEIKGDFGGSPDPERGTEATKFVKKILSLMSALCIQLFINRHLSRTLDLRIWILLFSSVISKMQTKISFAYLFCLLLSVDTFTGTSVFKDKKSLGSH